MQFKISKDLLVKLFKLAAFIVVEKKPGNNIVGLHVLLTVEHNTITVTATDLDVELLITATFSGMIIPGSAVVPFRKISDICRAMTDDLELEFAVDFTKNNKLDLKSSEGFFAINVLPPDLFPTVDLKLFHTKFQLKIKWLKQLISNVAFAMADDDGRPFLKGLLLELNPQEVLAVAADGHRLMLWQAPPELTTAILVPAKLLIPRKTVFDLLKIIGEFSEEQELELMLGANHFRVIIEQITYTSKLLPVQFPPYRKLIPLQVPNVLTVSRDLLKNCLLRAAALLGDRSLGIKLYFTATAIKLSAKNEQNDLVTDLVPAVLQGDELEICFNLKYLLDFLTNIHINTVVFKFSDRISGVLLQDPAFQSSYVLMPMQL